MLRRCRPFLGTFVEISAEHEVAVIAGFEAIARVHQLMSAHHPESDLSRINRLGHQQAVTIDDWTAACLQRANFWSRESDGAFDVARAGKLALERGLLPRHPGHPAAVANHWGAIVLTGTSVRLLAAACLDLGGIAKGFAVDRAVDAMLAAGASQGLVNAGGDVRAFGPVDWPIDVVNPASRVAHVSIDLQNSALATSGAVPCATGLSFTHLPDGGSPWASVTVEAANCCDADALTKIVWAHPRRAARTLRDHNARAIGMTKTGFVQEIGEEAFV